MFMAGWDDVVTYEQLEGMTPEERSEHFRASMVLAPETLSTAERERIAAMTARLDERAGRREDRLRGQAS